MEETKKWWQSKTVIASIVSASVAIAVGLRLLPADIQTEKDALIENAYALVGVVASVIAIYGRLTAKKTIKRKGN